MDDVVIRAENIGKQYTLGAPTESYRLIHESISAWVRDRFRSLRPGGKKRPQEESFWAVRDLSLEIKRGDVVGLIGGNGAGKSTTLKILSRITEPTCGRAEIHGRVGSLLEVGTGFHPELSGRENVYLNGAILGLRRQEVKRKFDELVAFAEVERFLDLPVKRYSSGMYMRLAFAVAAHLEPDVLLVDEVLAVGDVAFRKKCLAKLKSISADVGRTVIFVSHDMQAIQTLCQRVLHLEHGRVVHSGETRAVISRYLASIASRESYHAWEGEAPGNHEVRLKSLRVSSRGFSKGQCPINEDVLVTLNFDAEIVQRGLCIGFDVVTPDGTTVLRSYQTDLAEGQCPVAEIGMNSWQCRIPAGTLNVGEFYICPKLSIHNLYWIVDGGPVVRFEIVPAAGEAAQQAESSARPGSVAARLCWEFC